MESTNSKTLKFEKTISTKESTWPCLLSLRGCSSAPAPQCAHASKNARNLPRSLGGTSGSPGLFEGLSDPPRLSPPRENKAKGKTETLNPGTQ